MMAAVAVYALGVIAWLVLVARDPDRTAKHAAGAFIWPALFCLCIGAIVLSRFRRNDSSDLESGAKPPGV
jgi:hypothetical protein